MITKSTDPATVAWFAKASVSHSVDSMFESCKRWIKSRSGCLTQPSALIALTVSIVWSTGETGDIYYRLVRPKVLTSKLGFSDMTKTRLVIRILTVLVVGELYQVVFFWSRYEPLQVSVPGRVRRLGTSGLKHSKESYNEYIDKIKESSIQNSLKKIPFNSWETIEWRPHFG